MKVKKILAAFYIFGYLAQLRTESGDFFLVSKFGEKKTPKTAKKIANVKNNSPKKTPFSRECKFGRVLGFGDLGKRSVPVDVGILS
jgi:hypothetical protein